MDDIRRHIEVLAMSRVLTELDAFRAELLEKYPELGPDQPPIAGLVPEEHPKQLHWTQRPENAAKVRGAHRKARMTRKRA